MRIVHLSDLHFTTFFSENNLNQIEQALKFAIELEGDHIVITGDLTDNAVHKDFILLRKLFEKLNILYGNKLSLVIGNHDVFGGVQTAEDIFLFTDKCIRTDYNKKVKDFYLYFPELFDNSAYFNPEIIFPFAKIIDNFLFIGMNSIAEYSKVNNPFASNGTISMQQIAETTNILDKFRHLHLRKIVMVHHHFNKIIVKENSQSSFWQNIEKQTMKLRKKKRLLKIFKNEGVELILHGHYHESIDYERKGIRFSNAGASFISSSKKEVNVNIIDIDKKIDINIAKLPALEVPSDIELTAKKNILNTKFQVPDYFPVSKNYYRE